MIKIKENYAIRVSGGLTPSGGRQNEEKVENYKDYKDLLRFKFLTQTKHSPYFVFLFCVFVAGHLY